MEIFVAVLVLLAGMISNWYLQRREFRELARTQKRSEERITRMMSEGEERVTRILEGMKDIMDRMERRLTQKS